MVSQGDLGAIDSQYDVAISTACGSLDHIVVDTIDTGKKCIEFLKKNNIGQGRFILMDKVETWRAATQKRITTWEDTFLILTFNLRSKFSQPTHSPGSVDFPANECVTLAGILHMPACIFVKNKWAIPQRLFSRIYSTTQIPGIQWEN